MLNSNGLWFKSPLHHLQLYGFLNHFRPLENEALNTLPQGITMGRSKHFKVSSA